MKNIVVVVSSILLCALALTGCEMIEPPPVDDIHFNQDGQHLRRVYIYGDNELMTSSGRVITTADADASRSLTTEMAKTVYNYVEVIIMDRRTTPVRYYDTAFRKGVTGAIEVPENDFPLNQGAVNAVMFAGYRRTVPNEQGTTGVDLTLLAVGLCTGVEYNNSGTFVTGTGMIITPSTTGLLFSLRALETFVTAGQYVNITLPPGTTAGGNWENSFHITGGGSAATWGASTPIGANRRAPYFQVNSNAETTATFRIYGLQAGDTSVFDGLNPASAVWVEEANPALQTVSFVWGGDPILTKGNITLAQGLLTDPGNAANFVNGRFDKLTIITENSVSTTDGHVRWSEGWSVVAMSVRVRIFGDIVPSRRSNNDRWYLRSGMYLEQPDLGAGVDEAGTHSHSLGGGILLRVGNPQLSPKF